MRETPRTVLRSLTVLPMLSMAGGCAPAGELVIASHVWPGYELMFLARDQGWLPAEGLRLLEMPSASASLAALAAGQAQGATLTLDEVLLARSRGLMLSIVLVCNVSNGADVVLARQPLADLKQLGGRRVGVETSALGALMLHKLLKAAGLPEDAVEVVSVEVSRHLEVWDAREVDVLITYEPVSSQVQARGGVRVFDSRQLPETIFDLLAVEPKAARRHAKALRGLIGGHFRALHHLRHNPLDAAYRMGVRMGLDGPQALQAFRFLELPDLSHNRRYLGVQGKMLERAAGELARLMFEHGLVEQMPPLDGLLTDAYLGGGAP
ncbi:MAG: ABC transporter substrate-binding protein [Rhodocyclaceae bacterium]